MLVTIGKWTLRVVVALMLLAFLSLEVLYHFALGKIEPLPSPSTSAYSRQLLELKWVDLGESGDMEMVPMSPVGLVYDIFEAGLSQDPKYQKYFPPGAQVSGQAARYYGLDRQELRSLDRHLIQFALGIWISRNWGVEEAIATLLDRNYYGYGLFGIGNAARRYFGKDAAALTLDEAVALVATSRAPSMANPFCGSDRLIERAKVLQQALSRNWPAKYGAYKFSMPQVVEPAGELCPER